MVIPYKTLYKKMLLIRKFEELLFDNYFDIPINRIKDYKWLIENISIHNYDNSAITQAKVYLKAIVDNVVIRSWIKKILSLTIKKDYGLYKRTTK